jgi:hypothetical protein
MIKALCTYVAFLVIVGISAEEIQEIYKATGYLRRDTNTSTAILSTNEPMFNIKFLAYIPQKSIEDGGDRKTRPKSPMFGYPSR